MSTADGSVVGTTKIVDHGPSSERWDLVIMSDGYQTGQLAQFATDAQSFVDKLFATAPFDDPTVQAAINVHRVDVTSTDSGADDPKACVGGTGTTARTYFDATFCNDGNIQRALAVDELTALSVAGAQVPNWNLVMVIVNSTIYGGTGGAVAVFSLGVDANGNGADETGLHEMGHTAFKLADEYEYYQGCASGETGRDNHSGSEPLEANVTKNLDRATIKWGDLIDTTTALPTTSNADCSRCDLQANPVAADTVGAFEGARYFHCGLHRPQFNCRMRQTGQPFCAVCQREIRAVFSLYHSELELPVAGFGYDGGWRVERHPRFMADTSADGRADIVGFGNDGVWVSRALPGGGFSTPKRVVVGAFGYDGGWRVERHPRFLADTTNDGRADIVGFGDDGVWVSRAQPDGSYPLLADRVVPRFGYAAAAGGWRVERHPRLMADTTGDGRADIVGFGSAGVVISRAQPDGSFTEPQLVVRNFGSSAGGWRVDRHPRFMAVTTDSGRANIVGFGYDGVWVSRAQFDGSFTAPELVVGAFGYDAGWRVDRHPRFMADTTGDGFADIVGFGHDGVWVSRAQRDGSFSAPERVVVGAFGYDGGWRVERHPRFMADTTGDGRADIVGFGDDGAWVSRAQPDGSYPLLADRVVADFGYDRGWRVERHPRVMADTTGDRRADIVGFGDAGVYKFGVQPR